MNYKILITFSTLLICISISAQNNMKNILDSIECNNLKLKTLRASMEAEKLENKIDISLPDPNVEFNYLWRTPFNIKNRIDVNVIQKFNFSTILGIKRQFANEKNKKLDNDYRREKINLLFEATIYCVNFIYNNNLKESLQIRTNNAVMIEKLYKQRLENGDANILEYNKSKLNLTNSQNELLKVEIEINKLLSKLKNLNGGKIVHFMPETYQQYSLPSNFEEWYYGTAFNNPYLELAMKDIDIMKINLKLKKMEYIPDLYAGYMSEIVMGESFQGVSIGLSLPLWSNKNKIKQAKAAILLAETRQKEVSEFVHGYYEVLFNNAKDLKLIYDNLKLSLLTANSEILLKKALDSGEISLLEYIIEADMYYDVYLKYLEAEKKYQESVAEIFILNF